MGVHLMTPDEALHRLSDWAPRARAFVATIAGAPNPAQAALASALMTELAGPDQVACDRFIAALCNYAYAPGQPDGLFLAVMARLDPSTSTTPEGAAYVLPPELTG